MIQPLTPVSHQVTEWDHFLQTRRPDVGFKQSSLWVDFLATRKWSQFGFALRDRDELAGGAKVLVRQFAPGRSYYYMPHGPVLPDDEGDAAEIFAAMMEFIDNERQASPDTISHLRMEPLWTERPSCIVGGRELAGWTDPRNTLVIDLAPSEDEILAQMKPKGRYNIRLADRKGVSIVEDVSRQGVRDFKQLYDETFDRNRLSGHSTGYFRELIDRLTATDRGTLLFAEYEGLRLAAALLIYFGDTASYKYGGSTQAHKNVMAPYLLHFEAMRRAKARGHRWYDFCGISPPGADDQAWSGFSSFKRKFGGIERTYMPTIDFVFDEGAYKEYRGR